MTRLSLFACLIFFPLGAFSQAKPTADRLADLQIGGGYSNADSDYDNNRFSGEAVYTSLDLSVHHGMEFNLHLVHSGNGDQIAEQTYEFGYRYHRTYGRFKPFARAMYGRARFNFGINAGDAILAYNMFVFAGGTDITVTPRVNVRFDYEYQEWLSGGNNGLVHGLTPSLFTIGAAYHFPSGLRRGKHF